MKRLQKRRKTFNSGRIVKKQSWQNIRDDLWCQRPIIFVNVFRPYDMTPTNLVVWLKTDWRVTGSVDQWKKISQQWHWGVNDGRNMIVGSKRSQRSGIPGITTIFTILNISSTKCFQIEFCKTPFISNDRPLLRE